MPITAKGTKSKKDMTSKATSKSSPSNVSGSINVPYVNAYGTISKTLDRIKQASTPPKFTQDFLATKLDVKGGSGKPIIPFLKRTGFLNSDGSPTELYKEFRNDALRDAAAARAVKTGYSILYEINEYAHDLNDKDLKGLIVQATGLDANSSVVKSIMGSFKALKSYANFDISDSTNGNDNIVEASETISPEQTQRGHNLEAVDLKLGYTINLNLPATTDIAVFNAIFKSLRDNLLG